MHPSAQHAADGRDGRRGGRRTVRIIAELLAFVFLVVATAFILRPLQENLLRRMVELRDAAISSAETAIGRRLEYRSMGPSIFGILDLRGIRIVGRDGVPLASIARLRIGYSLGDLLRGNPVTSIKSISLDRPVFDIDTVRDEDLLAFVSRLAEDRSSGEASSPALRIRVRGGAVVWKDKRASLHLTEVSLTASLNEGRVFLDAGAEMTADLTGDFATLGEIRTKFSAKGELSSLGSGHFTFAVPSLSTAVAQFRPQTVLVVLSEKQVEFRKIKDRSPFDMSARYDVISGAWSADLLMERFTPRDLLSLRGPLSAYDTWMGTEASGSITLALEQDGATSYSFDLSGKLPSSSPLGDAPAILRGRGNQNSVEISEASILSHRGEADFSGRIALKPFRPEGTLHLKNVLLRDEKRLDADFSLASEGADSTFFADRLSIGGITFSAVDGRLHPDAEAYTFTLSALRFSETEEYEDVRLARFVSEGTFSLGEPFLQFSVSLDAFSAGEALDVARAFVSMPAIAGARILDDISVTTEVFITTDFSHLSFNAPRLVIAYRGGADVFAVSSVAGTDTRLEFRDARVIWKGGALNGGASVDFQDPADIIFSLQTEYRNIEYAFQGVILDGRTVSVQGDYDFSATVVVAESGDLSGVVSAHGIPLLFGERRLTVTIDSSFRWTSLDSWEVNLSELFVEGSGGADSPALRVMTRGSFDQNGAVLPRLSIDDGQGSLIGSARLGWSQGFNSMTASARLADETGLERYEVEGERSDEGVSARLYLSKGRIRRFFPIQDEAVATGELRLRWAGAEDYEASWRISEIKMKVRGEEFTASGSGTLSPDMLDLENASLSYMGFSALIEALLIDRPSRNANAAFRIRGNAVGRDTDVIAQIRLSFAPMADWRSFQEATASIEGLLDITRMRLGTLEVSAPFRLHLKKDEQQFSLSGGPNDSIRFQANSEGAFYAAFSSPSPLRGTLIGTIANGEIDARANNFYLDFASLWHILPIRDVVNLTGGFANGSLAVNGPIGDPEFTGSAHATGVRLVVPSWIDGPAGPAEVDVKFTGDGFAFGPAVVPMGTGYASVVAKFTVDRWIPSIFDLSVEVPRSAPIQAKADVAGVVGRGSASGNIRIVRQDGEISVTGLLTAESATIMLDPERYSLGRAEAPALPPYPIHVSLGLRTGRKVEFYWPSTNFPILRVSANADDSLGINYDGLSGRFALKGDVFLRGGEVFYFQRSFYVREGVIRFNESEVRMDPMLSVRAEIRDRYEEGPVTIALIVDESPLSSFMPRLESDPALSQIEIFSLLGQNLVNVDAQTGSASMQDSLLLASSDLLAQFNVIRRFERKARDLLGLDMFSVRTQVLQNAVLDAAGLRSEPVDRIGGLGNYFDNTTVYLGKYIGSDLFLQAMFSLQYEETKAENIFGGLELAPDIGIELKTPLFLLRWSFIPEHPENMYVDDQSFTLTWKKSF